jgi:hypothetical protein
MTGWRRNLNKTKASGRAMALTLLSSILAARLDTSESSPASILIIVEDTIPGAVHGEKLFASLGFA